MRKLMWFTIGFAAACAVNVYLSGSMWLLIIAFCVGMSLFFLKIPNKGILGVVLFGLVTGSVWQWGYDCLYLQAVKLYDGESVETSIEICDYSFQTDFGVAADGILTIQDNHYRVRVYIKEPKMLYPGDVVSGEFRLRLTTRDSLKGETYHQGDGIFLLAYGSEHIEIQKTADPPAKFFAAIIRRRITDTLDLVFPADTLAFARALLLGDSSQLTYEQDTQFKVSGIRHVMAVSGLHVSILFSLVYFISGRRRVFTTLIGLPVLILFAAVAGFTPSVVRACIMQGLMLLALLLKKEYDPPTALAFACLLMLGVNPMAITSVSFQLSVGCLIGIFLFYHRINAYLMNRFGVIKGLSFKNRLLRGISGSVSISLSTMIATTPMCAYYFGAVSLTGILTNLLTLWVISFAFYGIMLACILGSLWIPAAQIVAWVVSWPIRFVALMAKLLSGSVISAVYTCSIYIVIWLVLCYLLLILFLCSAHKRPRSLVMCTLAGLAVAVSLSWLEPQLDHYRVTVLDVGQGQAILFQCDGKNFLIDCGGDSAQRTADIVAQQLLSQGIHYLDGLILTHYDKDHAAGAMPLLSRIKTSTLYLPDIDDGNTIRTALENMYTDRIVSISEDTVLSAETMQFTLFPADIDAKDNESCMCVLFQTEKCDILITGDLGTSGEQDLINKTQLPELELLVIGHHGSAFSTGLPLLHAAKPAAAVISVGKNNDYGHPSEDVLYRLKLFGCSIWRTDLDGTIVFRG